MSDIEREGYIQAVKCLMSKPSISTTPFNIGTKGQYDDFVATVNYYLEIGVNGAMVQITDVLGSLDCSPLRYLYA